MSGNCNSRGLQSARSKRTPVTRGCSAPLSHGSSNRNRQRLRPARRPPTPKRSQIHRRQPAQTPPIRPPSPPRRPRAPKRSQIRRRQPTQTPPARTAFAAPAPADPEAIPVPPPPARPGGASRQPARRRSGGPGPQALQAAPRDRSVGVRFELGGFSNDAARFLRGRSGSRYSKPIILVLRVRA